MKDKGKALWVGPDGNGSSGKGKALWVGPDCSTSSGKGKALWIASDGNSSSLGRPGSSISPVAGTGGNADGGYLDLSLSLRSSLQVSSNKDRKLKGIATVSSLRTLCEDVEDDSGQLPLIRTSSLPNETDVRDMMIRPDGEYMLSPHGAGIKVYCLGGSSSAAAGGSTSPPAKVGRMRGGILNAVRVLRHSIALPDDHEDSFRKRKEFANMENKAAKRKKLAEAAGSSNPIASVKLFGTELSNIPSASPCFHPVPVRQGLVHPPPVPLATVAPAPQHQHSQTSMDDPMPCVSTTFSGPNGRRASGILYSYRSGEDVCIVCECHGAFLTPAEFVKHAGGGDVPNPTKLIVVSPKPPYL